MNPQKPDPKYLQDAIDVTPVGMRLTMQGQYIGKTAPLERPIPAGPIEPGIYDLEPGAWLTVEAEGRRAKWRAPDYDLDYLRRAYRGRLVYKGAVPDVGPEGAMAKVETNGGTVGMVGLGEILREYEAAGGEVTERTVKEYLEGTTLDEILFEFAKRGGSVTVADLTTGTLTKVNQPEEEK